MMLKFAIFGARSIALGVCLAVQELYKDFTIAGFLVSSREGNPDTLAGLPVYELGRYTQKDVCVLIATPEDVQEEIVCLLEEHGFHNHICVDSSKEMSLMEQYYIRTGEFLSLHTLWDSLNGEGRGRLLETGMHGIEVYMAKFHKDKPVKDKKEIPSWVIPVQAGAALTSERVAALADNSGENISYKNCNYSELTVLYWIWKNKIADAGSHVSKYYGLFHYRRWLDISQEDIGNLYKHNVDVVLPFPTVHEPDIREHHARYISESDWCAVIQSLKEVAPMYYARYDRIFSQQYLYNYNILIAKVDIMKEYCEWLFPILERVEEISVPKGKDRADRYIGYIGESLLTLYFMYHREKLRIAHTGRIMIT